MLIWFWDCFKLLIWHLTLEQFEQSLEQPLLPYLSAVGDLNAQQYLLWTEQSLSVAREEGMVHPNSSLGTCMQTRWWAYADEAGDTLGVFWGPKTVCVGHCLFEGKKVPVPSMSFYGVNRPTIAKVRRPCKATECEVRMKVREICITALITVVRQKSWQGLSLASWHLGTSEGFVQLVVYVTRNLAWWISKFLWQTMILSCHSSLQGGLSYILALAYSPVRYPGGQCNSESPAKTIEINVEVSKE